MPRPNLVAHSRSDCIDLEQATLELPARAAVVMLFFAGLTVNYIQTSYGRTWGPAPKGSIGMALAYALEKMYILGYRTRD